MHSILQGHAAGKILLHFDAAYLLLGLIAADKDYLDALVEHPRFLQDGRQRRPRPFGGADAAEEPRVAMVAGALERKDHLLPWSSLEILQCKRHRSLDEPGDLQFPRLFVDDRLVVVPDAEELVVGRQPGIQFLPLAQISDHMRHGIHWRLIRPGNDFFAWATWESLSEPRGMKQRQPS